MKNTSSRLEAMYPNHFDLSYDLNEGRFKTRITVPFELSATSQNKPRNKTKYGKVTNDYC